VFLVNLPFGFWRAGARKLSRSWFLAVHAPVPLVVAMRWLSGLGFQLATFPVLVGAFFAGQLVGGRLRAARGRESADPPEDAAGSGSATPLPSPSSASRPGTGPAPRRP
jgi:hypothetical protein